MKSILQSLQARQESSKQWKRFYSVQGAKDKAQLNGKEGFEPGGGQSMNRKHAFRNKVEQEASVDCLENQTRRQCLLFSAMPLKTVDKMNP